MQPRPSCYCVSFSRILLALHNVIAPSSIPPAIMPLSSSWSIQSSDEKNVGERVCAKVMVAKLTRLYGKMSAYVRWDFRC